MISTLNIDAYTSLGQLHHHTFPRLLSQRCTPLLEVLWVQRTPALSCTVPSHGNTTTGSTSTTVCAVFVIQLVAIYTGQLTASPLPPKHIVYLGNIVIYSLYQLKL
ncbi:unnamed protein product [Meganyctiphanes norvegica]|uniref:Uncharacterized protein n=1 Tax=Meganyctiphanes norvegica TaxID=48144 RepID=A0AAV2SUK2_MEGNR